METRRNHGYMKGILYYPEHRQSSKSRDANNKHEPLRNHEQHTAHGTSHDEMMTGIYRRNHTVTLPPNSPSLSFPFPSIPSLPTAHVLTTIERHLSS